MSETRFEYTIYIRASAEKVWDGLTKSDVTRRYWCEVSMESDWKKGSPWRMVAPNGRTADAGEVLEVEQPNKLTISWQHELMPELKAEGYSKAVFDLKLM